MIPREERHKVVIPATMRWEAGQVEICIRDISSRGMLLQAANAPSRGAYVEIVRPGCTVTARVVWSNDRRFGVQSRARIDLDAMLERRRAGAPRGTGAPKVQMEIPKYVAAPVVVTEERSRWLGYTLQSIALVGVGAAGAALLASTIYQCLVRSLGVAVAHM